MCAREILLAILRELRRLRHSDLSPMQLQAQSVRVCVCAFYIWHTSVLQGFRRQTVFGLGSDPQRGLEPVKKKTKLKTASLSISVALCPYHGGIEFIQYF